MPEVADLRTSVINEATKRKIPYIVYAATDFEDPFTTFLYPSTKTFRSKRSQQNFSLVKSIKKIKWEYFDPLFTPMKLSEKLRFVYHYLLSKYYIVRDNIRSKAPEGWNILKPSMHVSFDGKKTEALYLFDFIEYNPKKMIEILRKEVDWGAPPGRESRMDCKLGCFANYQYLRERNITKDGFTLSVLVRNGLLSREDALRKEFELRVGLKEECERVRSEIMAKR